MNAKILIADDESDIVSMLGSFFESKGFRVLPASNGAEALKQVEKQPDISVLFVVLLTAFATFWSIKKDTADYSDYIRNGGEQDADRFYTGRARIRGCFFLSA